MTLVRESPRHGTGSGRREGGAGRVGEGQGCRPGEPRGPPRHRSRVDTLRGEMLSRHNCPRAAFPRCFQRRYQLAVASPRKHSLTEKEEKQNKTKPQEPPRPGPPTAAPHGPCSRSPLPALSDSCCCCCLLLLLLPAQQQPPPQPRLPSPPRTAPLPAPPHGRHGQRPEGRCCSWPQPRHGSRPSPPRPLPPPQGSASTPGVRADLLTAPLQSPSIISALLFRRGVSDCGWSPARTAERAAQRRSGTAPTPSLHRPANSRRDCLTGVTQRRAAPPTAAGPPRPAVTRCGRLWRRRGCSPPPSRLCR